MSEPNEAIRRLTWYAAAVVNHGLLQSDAKALLGYIAELEKDRDNYQKLYRALLADFMAGRVEVIQWQAGLVLDGDDE